MTYVDALAKELSDRPWDDTSGISPDGRPRCLRLPLKYFPLVEKSPNRALAVWSC